MEKGIYELEPTRQGSSTISHQCDHNLWNEGVSDCKTPSPFSSLHHSSTESDSSSLAFSLPPSLPLSLSSLLSLISLFQSTPNSKSFPGSGPVHLTPQPKWNREGERHTFNNQRTRWKEQRTINNMAFFRPKVLLLLTAFIMSSGRTPLGVSGQRGDDVTTVTSETFTEDPNLVNDPATDETVLADIKPSTDDLASLNDKNTTTECRDEKFACTRLYSVHRPIKQCLHQICFTSSRRMYVINNEICSRLVCKEHEAMKDELCRQKAGLPPRRLRRSNYFRLPPCDNVNLQGPSGL